MIFLLLLQVLSSIPGVNIQDEGTTQCRTSTINFAGAGVSASCASGIATATISGGGSGSFSLTTVEVDLGSLARYSGTFDITTSGLTAAHPVLIMQAAGPYTNKGTLEDEAEMDQVIATGYTVSTTVIRVYWTCQPKHGPMKGNVKFNYVQG